MISRQLPAKTVLFEKKKDGTTYRIPALLHLPASGTLLAFAEERNSAADVDAKLLVVRRGELSGIQVKWEPMEVVRSAQLKGHRSMNPCPVYEGSTDTIFLFFIAIWDKVTEENQRQTGVNEARFCCVSSSDQGRSWSAARDLTKPWPDCATFGLGPGHGIQLGCGRLLLPAYAYRIDAKESDSSKCETSPHSFTFYSDDKGKSWRAGKLLSAPQTVECQLVWLDQGPGQAQGTVYCNARTLKYYRAQALSLNRGAAFQKGQLILTLPENGCHGSVVGFPSLGLVPGLAQGSGTSEWEPMEVVGSAQLKGHRSMNPCPVYEGSTKTIFLFFIAIWHKVSEQQQLQTGVNAARFCCVSSSDQGRSWSAARDLTEPTLDCCLQDWATFALGPGHGIQLGCGRLLLPAYAYLIDGWCMCKCKTSPHSFAFYSDDKGKSWRAGELLSAPPTVECQLVWLDQGPGQAQGTVYCNARTLKYYRAQALSLNRGTAFQEGQHVWKLPEPKYGCHGSVVGVFPSLGLVPGLAQGSVTSEVPPTPPAPTWALFCHPTCPESRIDLGLYLSVSPPDPEAWTEPWVINYGHSAYSDLAYVEPSDSRAAFACLYECGTKTPYDTITFSLVTVQEVLENVPPGGSSKELSTAARTACCCVT